MLSRSVLHAWLISQRLEITVVKITEASQPVRGNLTK